MTRLRIWFTSSTAGALEAEVEVMVGPAVGLVAPTPEAQAVQAARAQAAPAACAPVEQPPAIRFRLLPTARRAGFFPRFLTQPGINRSSTNSRPVPVASSL